jgi:predicted metallo-beta-lactamase superfamily hydrolase
MTLTLPDSFTVIEVPPDRRFSLPDHAAQYARVIQINNNILTMRCKLEINKTFYRIDEYHALRDLYNQIVNCQTEVLVLKKKAI